MTRIVALVTAAREAAQRLALNEAISLQTTAVSLIRQLPTTPENRQNLGLLLYNLAGYHQDVQEHETAVSLLEEVVLIDRELGSADLTRDEAVLAQAKRLAQLSPDELAELERASRAFLQMTPEAREQLRQQKVAEGMREVADEFREAALRVRRGEADGAELLARLETAVVRLTYDDALGEARHELAAFLQAVGALLKNEPLRPVPDAYVPDMMAIQAAAD
mgnify:CR=1 FL=1